MELSMSTLESSKSFAEKQPNVVVGVPPLSSWGWFRWHLLSVSKQAPASLCLLTVWTLNRLDLDRTMAWSTLRCRVIVTEQDREPKPYLAIHSFKPTSSPTIMSHILLCTLCHWISLRSSGCWHNCCHRRRQRKEKGQWTFTVFKLSNLESS